MNMATLIFSYIRRRPLTWSFHLLTLALGVGVVASLLLLQQSMDDRFNRDIGQVNLVVGAKGSPLQLILSSLFQIDTPAGNITLAQANQLAHNPLVALSAPVSIGDNVRGMRIVGTSPDYAKLYGATLARGRWAGPMEAVLGDQAFRQLGLKIGQTFVGEHGLAPGGERHAKTPYRVVGVLKPTGAVIDRLVLADTASVWRVHADETDPSKPLEVTSLLVHYRSAMGAVVMPQLVRAMPDLQAAVPAIELARLNRLLGAGAEILRAFGVGLLAISALGFFLAMFGAVNQRQRELALLRTLGARPALLVGLVAGEGLLLGALSGVAGVGLARFAVTATAAALARHGGPALVPPRAGMLEVVAIAGALAIALAASILPSFIAYRVDPARALKSA
jgi:putative ABC transport system permease protein